MYLNFQNAIYRLYGIQRDGEREEEEVKGGGLCGGGGTWRGDRQASDQKN